MSKFSDSIYVQVAERVTKEDLRLQILASAATRFGTDFDEGLFDTFLLQPNLQGHGDKVMVTAEVEVSINTPALACTEALKDWLAGLEEELGVVLEIPAIYDKGKDEYIVAEEVEARMIEYQSAIAAL